MNNKFNIIFIIIYFFIISLIAFFCFNVSSDTWWHISSGKQIVLNKGLPDTDNFYCAGSYKWYSHEWLFDVVSFLIFNETGQKGIKIFCFFIFLLVIFFIFLNSYYLSFKNIKIAFILTALSVFFLLPFTEERPQLFTMLFFALFIYFGLNRFNHFNFLWFILLIFLSLLWANIHYTIIAAIFILIICTVFSEKPPVKLLPQIFLIISIIIISIFNPAGIKIFNFFSKDLWLKQFIREWQGLLQFSDIYFFIYQLIYFLTGIFIIVFFIKVYNIKEKFKIFKLLFIILSFFIPGILSKKTIIFFAISLPAIAIFLKNITIKQRTFILLYILLFLISFMGILNKTNINYPYKIKDFIQEKISDKCIFCSFEIGGFIEFFTYPQNKVFLNGRLNTGKDILFDYSIIYHCDENYKEIIKKYNLQIFLIDNKSTLFKNLLENKIMPVIFEKGYGLFIINKI